MHGNSRLYSGISRRPHVHESVSPFISSSSRLTSHKDDEITVLMQLPDQDGVYLVSGSSYPHLLPC